MCLYYLSGRIICAYIVFVNICCTHPIILTYWYRGRGVLSPYNDVIMSTMASQITSLTIVYSTVYSGADQRKYQSSASLAFVRGIHRSPVNSPRKGPVTRKCFHLMTSTCYFIHSIPLLMMTWRHKKPRHQKPWYWPSCPVIFLVQHQQSWITPHSTSEQFMNIMKCISQTDCWWMIHSWVTLFVILFLNVSPTTAYDVGLFC